MKDKSLEKVYKTCLKHLDLYYGKIILTGLHEKEKLHSQYMSEYDCITNYFNYLDGLNK